jgi:hypothetical protein
MACALPQPYRTAAADAATVAADSTAAAGLEFSTAGAVCVSAYAQAKISHATPTDTNGDLSADLAYGKTLKKKM